MADDEDAHVRWLLERLIRVGAAEDWGDDLNPAQRAALSYLDRANRFSRSPSQVAEYLTATRGTVSQTLKALARKGLIEERRREADKRSISYDVTSDGRAALSGRGALTEAVSAISAQERAKLETSLSALLKRALAIRGGRSFGVCRSCRHHREGAEGRSCALLDVALSDADAEQICFEHA